MAATAPTWTCNEGKVNASVVATDVSDLPEKQVSWQSAS